MCYRYLNAKVLEYFAGWKLHCCTTLILASMLWFIINFMHYQQKPESRTYWSYKRGSATVEFGNTPFIVGDSQHLQCQFGPQYYKSKPKKEKHLRLQSTRKMGCPAHMVIKQYTLFPDYEIQQDEIEGKSKNYIRCLKEQWLQKLLSDSESGCVKQVSRYWLSLPTIEAHEKTHTVKQAAVFSQKVNRAVAQMIAELHCSCRWYYWCCWCEKGTTSSYHSLSLQRFPTRSKWSSLLPYPWRFTESYIYIYIYICIYI